MTSNKILITGCPRSGTTLMGQLVAHGFSNVIFLPNERKILEFTELVPEDHWVVAKRARDASILRECVEQGFWVIWMTRDPRDVVVSIYSGDKNRFRVDFPRWYLSQQRVARIAGYSKLLMVSFEKLLKDPETLQIMIENSIGLKRIRSFNECWRYFDTFETNPNIKALNSVRPMDSSVIGGWKRFQDRITKTVELYPEILDCLIDLGYETDRLWLQKTEFKQHCDDVSGRT